ncbi:MAG: acyl carrier protein [Barnesiella sp.]|nr:acyl carrier protein [Barnesiella sp.]
MDLTEFIEKFIEVFDEPENLTLSPDTYFKELDEYSSLTALAIIAFADENFEVSLTGKDIRSVDTIQDLYDLIRDKIND